jgi:NADH dehydrogenase FAD-containing subunit
LKPIVLVGGGDNHYRLIHSLNEDIVKTHPIILVAKNNKYFSNQFLPLVIGDILSMESGLFDLWSVCQRKNVYFIQDDCVNINREEKILYLEKYGKINYHMLSIETDCKAYSLTNEVREKASLFANHDPSLLFKKLKSFLSEVHRHCPKEIRIVFTGLSPVSLDLAYFLNKKLQKSCEKIDLVFICQSESREFNKKNLTKRIKKKLADLNIRVLFTQPIEKITEHKIYFLDEKPLEFDIYIPFDQWQSQDSIGRLFQKEGQKILVHRDLSHFSDSDLFFTGQNVYFNNENQSVESILKDELVKVLRHNLFIFDKEAPRITCRQMINSINQRPYLLSKSLFSYFNFKTESLESVEKIKVKTLEEIKNLNKIEVLEISKKQLEDKLTYDSQHMSRPWQGTISDSKNKLANAYRLISTNGFNSHGSYTQSTLKICEWAYLKTISRGIQPERLRFNLTLARDRNLLDNHIFESTFKAIEEFVYLNQIEIDGGDTFDGEHWQLSITLGGQANIQLGQKFQPHDYLIMTRPLGFGFLWANRLHECFDSKWITESLKSKIHTSFKNWTEFVNEYNPSTAVFIEEWGFLYHCLQALPINQQLMINFREVPRWSGIEKLLNHSQVHPGLDLNWERIKDSVAFKRSEVSLNNSILWDSLSQGALVIGVKAQDYKKAIESLKQLGFNHTSLVGCIRPKNSNNRIVLSDWTP